MKIKELELKIREASKAYYSGEPILTDEEFDNLVDKLSILDPNSLALKEVGFKGSSLVKKKHKIPMGSLLKVNTFDELKSFGSKYSSKDEFLYSEKIDGLSVSLFFNKGIFKEALTRGDGQEGEDITSNVSKMKFSKKLKEPFTGFIRGEIYLEKSVFEENFKDGKNPRNIAAGTVRRLDGSGSEHLSISCYWIEGDFTKEIERFDYLKKIGLKTPKYGMGTMEEIHKVWQNYENGERESSNYEIDGICVYSNLIKDQDEFGIVDDRPRYARAYKFSPQSATSMLIGYTFQVGRTGRITPVGIIKPVNIAGATISKVSLHNRKEIESLNLKNNSIVKIERKGDVIPQITEASGGNGNIIFPKKCPSCNSTLELEDIYVNCVSKDCKDKNVLSILFWLQTIGVKGVGDKLVEKLYDSKIVKDIKDLYSLKEDDILSLERMGDKSAKKIINEISSRKKIKPELFLKAIGIMALGESVSKKLFEKFTINDLVKIKEKDLEGIPGIGPELTKIIVSGFKERGKEILELSKIISFDVVEKESSKLSGNTYVFSEVRDKDLESKIESNGGKISGSVSKNTTILIVKSKDGTSSKIEKAKELGVQILNIDEFKKII